MVRNTGKSGKEHQGKGAMDRIKGKAKDAWGSVTGDRAKQAEGKAQKGKGAAQQKAGEAKEKVENKPRH